MSSLFRIILHRIASKRERPIVCVHRYLSISTSGHNPAISPSSTGSDIRPLCFALQEGDAFFSSASVQFRGSDSKLALEAARAAAEAACAALGGRTPSFCLAFSSAPEPLLRPMLSEVIEAAPEGTSIAGCSTLKLTCGGIRNMSGRFHITVAAAHLPNIKVHEFHSIEDSLPAVSNIAAALTNYPPQFLVLAAHEAHLGVKERIENLFGQDSCLAIASGTLTTGTRRTAVLEPGLLPSISLGISSIADDYPAGGGGLSSVGVEGGLDGNASPLPLGRVRGGGRGGLRRPSSNGVRAPPESASIGGGLDEATEELVAVANEALELALRYRGPVNSVLVPSTPTPLVFSGTRVFSSGCSGLTLVPQHPYVMGGGGSGGLSPRVVSALSRVMLGQDKFSVLEVQEAAQNEMRPLPTPLGEFVVNPMLPVGKAETWRAVPGLGAPLLHSVGPETGATNVTMEPRPYATRRQQQQQQEPSASIVSSPRRTLSPTENSVKFSHAGPRAYDLLQDTVPLLKGLPLFEIGKDFVLFPGQLTQIRIFEKRYQLLMKHLIEGGGGCFGFPIDREMGITAGVTRYLMNDNEFYVIVEGGLRFSYRLGLRGCWVLPGTFGLSAVNATHLHDLMPSSGVETETVLALAKQLLTLVHDGVIAAKSSQVVSTAGLFSAALHMAGSSPGGSPSAAVTIAPAAVPSSPFPPRGLTHALGTMALLEEAKARMDLTRAQALSLYLASCMPVDLETKRSWFTSISTVQRLAEQVEKMQLPNLRMATSAEVLRQHSVHPLRDLVNMPWTNEEGGEGEEGPNT